MIPLLPEDLLALARALYVAGVFVSEAEDVVHTQKDDAGELTMLHRALERLAKDGTRPALVRDVAEMALEAKAQWPVWRDQGPMALKILKETMDLLSKARAGEADLQAWRGAVLGVASAVARAEGEFAAFGEEQKGFLARLLAPKSDSNNPQNVSAGEGAALMALAEALHLPEE